MANSKMSVEEMLAACRKADGGAGDSAANPPDAAAAASEPAASEPAAKAAAPKAAAAKPTAAKKPSAAMSVEDMLAAARGEKSSVPAESEATTPDAAATPAAPAKKPSAAMSIEDMLAAGRGEKGPAKPAAAKPAAAKPAKAAAEKGAAAKPIARGAAAVAAPADTSSILAAARKGAQRGPISKSEAAEKGVAVATATKMAPVMPEKPAYAAAKPSKSIKPPAEDRRGFLSVFFGSFLALGFVCLGSFSALWGLGIARFMFPNILTEPPSRFKVGFPAEFPPEVVVTKFIAQFGVWVVNTEYEGQQQIVALKSVCTHLGCTPNWLEGEQKYKCPCHGSGFYKDGINFEGPAPRPLERYSIRVADDGQLEIDKSRKFQQEMGQWKETASYVPV